MNLPTQVAYFRYSKYETSEFVNQVHTLATMSSKFLDLAGYID